MHSHENPARSMPDIALHGQPHHAGVLDWVGMDGIAAPVAFDGGDGVQRAPAEVGVFVNLLRPDRRGIHMSRLYLLVDECLSTRTLDAPMLEDLLRACLASQQDLADRARIRLRFDYLLRRPALRSGHSGWRAYPVWLDAHLDGEGFRLELGTEVLYASTCPASAALARQLIQEQFARDFPPGQPLQREAVLAWLGGENGIVATPHAQRSVARIQVRFAEGARLALVALIDRAEQALGTPVQTAVKREDEQAFARANGANLMFCEDAARRLQQALESDAAIVDFRLRLEHQESLHAHDAVAYASKGMSAPDEA